MVELALLVGLAALLTLSLAARPLLEALWSAADGGSGPNPAFRAFLRETVRALLMFGTFSAVYAVVPRGTRRWQAVLTGAATATLLFLLARFGFGVVLGPLWRNLQLVYGPLAVAVLLLVWAWYVALITLFGGSVASHVKTMLVEGLDPGAAARRHVPRKAVADTDAGCAARGDQAR